MKTLLGLFMMLCICTISLASEGVEKLDFMEQKTVILDAGHGGIDPISKEYVTKGKRSPEWEDGTQYLEGVGNRDIVKRAAKLLNKKGVKVCYTVIPEDHTDLGLLKRVKIADKHYIDSNRTTFGISIHSNGYSKESAKGSEVFTSPGETKSDKIATIWMEEFGKQFPDIKKRTDFEDGDIDKEAKFTIIHETKAPFILIEPMFHTNRKECEILMSCVGRQKIAQAICNTVLRA